MKSKGILTSLTAAALAGAFLSGANISETVKADVKPDGTTTKAKSVKENAQANVDSAQKDVDNAQQGVDSAKKDLDTAKQNAVKPDSDYKAQKDEANAAQKTADEKKAVLDKANDTVTKAAALDSDAKDINKVKQADDDVVAKSKVLDEAKKKQKIVEQNIKDQEDQITQNEATVDGLIKKQNQKITESIGLSSAIEYDKTELKRSGYTDAKNTVDTSKENIVTLNNNIQESKKILEKAKEQLKQDQAKYDAANQKYSAAREICKPALDEVKKSIEVVEQKNQELSVAKKEAQSAAGFFKSLAEDSTLTDEQRKDAQQAYDILTNNGKFQNIKLDWYDPNKQLGKDGDATSLANMQAALEDLDELVKVRREYGLKIPKISLTATAIAMMSSDFQSISDEFNHPILMTGKYGPFFKDEEDIAAGTDHLEYEQVRSYMTEKQYIDNAIAKNPDLQKYAYDNGPLTISKWETNTDFWKNQGLYEEIGHYTSMINPAQDSLGAARVNGRVAEEYDGASSIDILQTRVYEANGTSSFEHGSSSFTIDQYKDLVNKYITDPGNSNAVKVARNNAAIAMKKWHEDQAVFRRYADETGLNDLSNDLMSLDGEIQHDNHLIQLENTNIDNYRKEIGRQKNNLLQAQSKINSLMPFEDRIIAHFNKSTVDEKNVLAEISSLESRIEAAKSDLTKAYANLKDLQAQAKTNMITQAQTNLDKANERVNELKNAAQKLTQAKADQATAQAEYDTAKKAADDAQTKLKTLETAKSASDAQVSAAQTKYDQAVAKLNTAKAKLDDAKNALERIQQADNLINQPTTSQTTPDTGNSVGQTSTASQNSTTTSNQTTTNTNSQTSTDTTNQTNSNATSSTEVSTKKTIHLTRDSYVYTRDLKPVRTKSHKKVVLKKNCYLKALKSGKIVTIKGKKFYQIGKNRFVRVSNTVAKKAHVFATIKARKNHKVRVYLANGKFAKKYVLGQKTYKFAEKKTIKGKTYYRISGKKLWVRAKDLKLVK